MLEILALILLCNVNSKNAVKRGRKPGAFVLLTLVLWIGMEILGAAIGAAADMGVGMYGLAILFAAIGAVASYLIARNCKPGPHVDPLQAAANGTAAQVPPQMSQPLQPPQGASGAQGGFCVMSATSRKRSRYERPVRTRRDVLEAHWRARSSRRLRHVMVIGTWAE